VVEGVRAVEELLKSPLSIQGVLSGPQLADAPRGQALLEKIASSRIEHAVVKEVEFRSAAETESPQGVLAIAEMPSRSLDSVRREGKSRRASARRAAACLESPNDVHSFAAIA